MSTTCNVTGKEMLGNRRAARKALKFLWAKGCRKVYWCIFCESYHPSSAKRGNWSKV